MERIDEPKSKGSIAGLDQWQNLPNMQAVWGPKSLQDMIRGIRLNKKNEASYIGQCLGEIKTELKQEDHDTKANAVAKITYLQMLGYDVSWAAFNIIEVMSQPKFTHKRIAYLAASQTFNDSTEVSMLSTALFKKAFTTGTISQYETGLALNCLANICTPDLARDLASDVVSMLNSSRPFIRQKAVLLLYKIFLRFPEALRPSFPRLKERLEDDEQAVVCSAVNVICELARKNPKNYLPLAPTLFKIMQSSSNNWVLIKIIKLFGALAPMERRLGKRLISPLTTLLNSTTAMSLLYECIQTCIIGLSHRLPLMKLCIQKLRMFIEDPDQNLKYLGLLALSNIMKEHPKAVGEHRDLIIKCLDDPDVTIRLRALDLLTGMVTKKNLPDLVKKLLEFVENSDGYYKNDLIKKTIDLCCRGSYQYITDFEWYLKVLMSLTRVQGNDQGALIANQFMDVIIRVEVVRSYGVKCMIQLLRDAHSFADRPGDIQEVLYAAVWLVGEYARYARGHADIISLLVQPRVALLSANVQSIYMQNVLKIFAYVAGAVANPPPPPENDDDEEFEPVDEKTLDRILDLLVTRLPLFKQSHHLEVQERACFVLELLQLFIELRKTDGQNISSEIASLFSQPLNPVAPIAQKKVPVPKGLDLDAQINVIPEPEDDSDKDDKWWEKSSSESEDEAMIEVEAWRSKRKHKEKEEEKPKERPKVRRPDSPWILSTNSENAKRDKEREKHLRTALESRHPDEYSSTSSDEENPPIGTLSDIGLDDPFSRKVRGRKKSKKEKKNQKTPPRKRPVVLTGFDMPEGAEAENEGGKGRAGSFNETPKKTGIEADVDLCSPLAPDEVLPVRTHRIASPFMLPPSTATRQAAVAKEEAKKKERTERRKERSKTARAGKPHRKSSGSSEKGRKKSNSLGPKDKKTKELISSYENGPRLIDFDDTPSSSSQNLKSSASSPLSHSARDLLTEEPLYGSDANLNMEGGALQRRNSQSAPSDSAPGGSSRRNSFGFLRQGFMAIKDETPSSSTATVYNNINSTNLETMMASSSTSPSSKTSSKRNKKEKEKGDRREKERRHRTHSKDKGTEKRSHRHHKDKASQEKQKDNSGVEFHRLFKNEHLRVSFAVKTATSEPHKVAVGLKVTNSSDAPLTDLRFTCTDTMNTKLISPAYIEQLGPRQKTTVQLIFKFVSMLLPQKIKAFVSYALQQKGAMMSKAGDFEIHLACSEFMVPVPMSLDDFAKQMRGFSGLSLSSTSVELGSRSTADCFKSLAQLLHLAVVTQGDTEASYYGQSVQGHNVLVLAKVKGGRVLSVDLKCSDGILGGSLSNEVNHFFSKK